MNISESSKTYLAYSHFELLHFTIGSCEFTEMIPIICPNEVDNAYCHIITKNGNDTHHSQIVQQYRCKTCGRTFYAHTSREVNAIDQQLRDYLSEKIQGGRLNSGNISSLLNTSHATASRILQKILNTVALLPNYRSFRMKHRNSSSLFLDETFLNICGHTWYLIVVLSGNGKFMDFRLVKHRTKEIFASMISDAGKRLNYGLKTVYTDGFMAYKGAIQELKQPIIHVRHIHRPPYGRIEVDTYTFDSHHMIIHTLKTTNELPKAGGYFLGWQKIKRYRLGTMKRGRKAGGKNRSKGEIEFDKCRKRARKGKRGRPKGCKMPRGRGILQVFEHNIKDGCVRAVASSSELIAKSLTRVFREFPAKCITTNLVENVFSVLKKLVNFRGYRTPDGWKRLLVGYFILRDDPKILQQVLNSMNFSTQLRQQYYSRIGGIIAV